MPSPHNPEQNQLLAALPAEVFERLLPNLELVPLPLGWALYESGHDQRYVYFPTTGVISLICMLVDGSSTEMAVVGNEGMIGIALFMGGGNHTKPGCSNKCRIWLSTKRHIPEKGI